MISDTFSNKITYNHIRREKLLLNIKVITALAFYKVIKRAYLYDIAFLDILLLKYKKHSDTPVHRLIKVQIMYNQMPLIATLSEVRTCV